ncbi:Hypothetical predicted protein [Lecanosticta acicola]|uniref:Uncharacterized protein n=1 Tax=Lecanosticta acicola TaxID=111012 RepID=A0AAI8Z8E7_9PEZI|nr:Hypothetical predicted protein [Lecanosticta acicola]
MPSPREYDPSKHGHMPFESYKACDSVSPGLGYLRALPTQVIGDILCWSTARRGPVQLKLQPHYNEVSVVVDHHNLKDLCMVSKTMCKGAVQAFLRANWDRGPWILHLDWSSEEKVPRELKLGNAERILKEMPKVIIIAFRVKRTVDAETKKAEVEPWIAEMRLKIRIPKSKSALKVNWVELDDAEKEVASIVTRTNPVWEKAREQIEQLEVAGVQRKWSVEGILSVAKLLEKAGKEYRWGELV